MSFKRYWLSDLSRDSTWCERWDLGTERSGRQMREDIATRCRASYGDRHFLRLKVGLSNTKVMINSNLVVGYIVDC